MTATGGILAIDLAEHVGWAYCPPSAEFTRDAVCWGHDELRTEARRSRRQTEDDWVALLLFATEQWFETMLARWQPALVVVEGPWIGRNVQTGRRLHEQHAIIRLACWTRHIARLEPSVAECRKAALGKTRIPRGEGKAMVREWAENLGFYIAAYDESDALAVLAYGVQAWKHRKAA